MSQEKLSKALIAALAAGKKHKKPHKKVRESSHENHVSAPGGPPAKKALGVRDLVAFFQNPTTVSAVSTDVKTPLPPAVASTPQELVAMAKSNLKNGLSLKDVLREMGVNRQPMTVMLWYSATQTGSANTAFAFAQRLRAGDSTEFADFADIFDEYKVLAATVHYHLAFSGTAPSANVDFAVAYDPANAGLYASIAAVLPAQYHQLLNVAYAQVTSGCGAPQCVTKNGMWTHKFPLPTGVITNSSGVGTGAWTDTSFSAIDYGYWKGYAGPAGSGTIVNFGLHIGLKVTFKMRS